MLEYDFLHTKSGSEQSENLAQTGKNKQSLTKLKIKKPHLAKPRKNKPSLAHTNKKQAKSSNNRGKNKPNRTTLKKK